jgi:hypothetical protein
MNMIIVAVVDPAPIHVWSIWDWINLSNIGSWASIIGLILSIYIFVTAYRINNYIMFNERLPQLLANIEKYTSNISDMFNNFEPSTNAIREQLSRCSANLKSLKKKVNGDEKKLIASIVTSIEGNINLDQLSKPSIRRIYLDLRYLIEAVQNLQQDFRSRKQ